MKADEISFWLQWYSDWQDVIEAGDSSMKFKHFYDDFVGNYPYLEFDGSGQRFEDAILGLNSLIERASKAPVSELCRRGETWDSYYARIAKGESGEGKDWPAPSVTLDAENMLRNLVREPYAYSTADYHAYPLVATPLKAFQEIVAEVRAIQYLKTNLPDDRAERETIVDGLWGNVYMRLLEMPAVNFLSKNMVEESLEAAGLGLDAIAPFHRFVDANISTDRLTHGIPRPAVTNLDETDFDCPRAECSSCGKDIEDLDIDLGGSCWDCQCGV